MIKIGLTGPTGAGKSTVAAVFAAAGVPVIDADKLAREVTLPGEPTLAALSRAFGADILFEDGTLDRKKLAARAFSSPENTARLNAVTHPAILQKMNERLLLLQKAGTRAVVLDAPLLFEAGLHHLCDHTVAVLAPEALRLARIRERDSLDDAAARLRLQAQPAEEFYRSRAETVLQNDGDPAALERQAKDLLARIAGWQP